MLQNKKFIALLIVLLFFVGGYNIRYFSNKDSNAVTELKAEERNGVEGFSKGIHLERGRAMEKEEMALAFDASRFPSEPLPVLSIEVLKAGLSPFSPEGMKRNPFLTEEESLEYLKKPQNKSIPRKRKTFKSNQKTTDQKNLGQKVETQISSADIKMIYRLGEDAYVWIRGRAWQEGETIEQMQILKINDDSILLKQGDTRKVLFINRDTEAGSKGVQLNYEK